MALRRALATCGAFRRVASLNLSQSVHQFHIYPASCALDPPQFMKRSGRKGARDYLEYKQLVADFVNNNRLEGVESLKNKVIQTSCSWNEHTFDSNFLDVCLEIGAFDVGKQFFVKLYGDGKAGIGAIGKFFILCYKFKHECEAVDRQLILKLYDDIVSRYEILDAATCEAFAQGVGLTERWRLEIPKLLDMVSYSGIKSSSPILTTAVEVALNHGDRLLAWKYMDSIADGGKMIQPRLIDNILQHHPSQLKPFLRWLAKHGIILSLDCAKVVMKYSAILDVCASISEVPRNGICSCCSQHLLSTPLSNEDFNHLRSAFLDPVFIGKNIFLKTNPDELKNYLDFLNQVLPVDVVLDGLNILYVNKKIPVKRSAHLKNVVSYFASRSRKILLIGRRHLNSWQTSDMDYVRRQTCFFLTENTSEDDPFILYATLKSGLGTKFVSRDQMTGHRHLLGTPKLRRLFSKWQALHQFYPVSVGGDKGNVILRHPLQICREAQQTSSLGWHLPCVDYSQMNVEGHLQDEKSPWLCIRLNSDNDGTKRTLS